MQLDTSWSHLGTPQEQRKQPDLTEKCLKQKVVPGLFQSSQATVLELLASADLLGALGRSLTPPEATWTRPRSTENDQT